MAGKQVLTKVKHKAEGDVSSNRDMPDFLEYLHYLHHDMGVLSALDTSLTGFLDVIIRGDAVPVGGCTWVQLSIAFANFGRLSRMLPYQWTLQGRGCTHKPLLQVPNPFLQVVTCILHALMCIGAIVANEVHSVCVGQDPAVIVEVAQILRDYKTCITFKGKAEPDGEESWRLLVAWNQLSHVLYIDSSIDAAVEAMSRTLTALYETWYDPLALQIGKRWRGHSLVHTVLPPSPRTWFFVL